MESVSAIERPSVMPKRTFSGVSLSLTAVPSCLKTIPLRSRQFLHDRKRKASIACLNVVCRPRRKRIPWPTLSWLSLIATNTNTPLLPPSFGSSTCSRLPLPMLASIGVSSIMVAMGVVDEWSPVANDRELDIKE